MKFLRNLIGFIKLLNNSHNFKQRFMNIEEHINELNNIKENLKLNAELSKSNAELLKKINMLIQKKMIDDTYVNSFVYHGEHFFFRDALCSSTFDGVTSEISRGDYTLEDINFVDNDCIIDIGANIGIISIILAKLHPGVKIYAFEPVKRNYINFIHNIKLNNIPNGQIIPYNMAVTKDCRDVNMLIDINNTGGSTVADIVTCNQIYQQIDCKVKSISLKKIIEDNNISKIKLLKIDCEGSEYEILRSVPYSILEIIDNLRGEFHENKKVEAISSSDELLIYCKKYIKNVNVSIMKNYYA